MNEPELFPRPIKRRRIHELRRRLNAGICISPNGPIPDDIREAAYEKWIKGDTVAQLELATYSCEKASPISARTSESSTPPATCIAKTT